MNTKALIIQLIPLAVPILLAVVKRFIPRLPKVWLPILAPLLGAGIDLLAHFSLGASTLVAALLGAAGVGLREIYDQVKQALATAAADRTA